MFDSSHTAGSLVDTGEACTLCGANLAPDQRYCVECGQRRGRPNAPFGTSEHGYDDHAHWGPDDHSPWRLSANTSLIAGVATLLIALLVGVIIGRGTNGSTQRASTPAPEVVTIAGAGAGTAATAAPATAGTAAASTANGAATPAATATNAKGTAGAAATPKSPTVTHTTTTTTSTSVDSTFTRRATTGPNRPGYKNGKFTGNFFGQ